MTKNKLKTILEGLVHPDEPSPSSARPSVSNSTVLGPIFPCQLTKDFAEAYTISKKLGEGGSGVTHLVVKDRSSGRLFACKAIPAHNRELVRREVEVLHHLAGYPNIIDFAEAIEGREDVVHVVVEYAEGGSLHERMHHLFKPPPAAAKPQNLLKKLPSFKRKPCGEAEARRLFRQIATALRDCHGSGVMHRDVKPKNLVFLTKRNDSPLKLINFGQCNFFKPGEMFDMGSRGCLIHSGEMPYVAPEIAKNQRYGPKADIWSAGVILYSLLSGAPPFWADVMEDLPEAIRQSNYNDYTSNCWLKISDTAKDLLSGMLKENPEERISAAQILEHGWFDTNGVASSTPREIPIITRMKQFQAMTMFKRVAFLMIAENLLDEEAVGWIRIFKSLSETGESLTFEELKKALHKWGDNPVDSKMDHPLFDSIDLDGDERINLTEFVAGTMPSKRIDQGSRLSVAFQKFGIDEDGYISRINLRRVLKVNGFPARKIEEICAEIYQDRKINYEEFLTMVKN